MFDPLFSTPAGDGPPATSPQADPDTGGRPVWVCDQCGRTHEYRPVTCTQCGWTAFTRHGPAQGELDHPDIDEGFPTPTTDLVKEFTRPNSANPIVWQEVVLVVLLCVAFLVGLFLYALA